MTPPPRPPPVSPADAQLVARTAAALERIAEPIAMAALNDARLQPVADALTAAIDRSAGWVRELAPDLIGVCEPKVPPGRQPRPAKERPAGKVRSAPRRRKRAALGTLF